MFGWSRSKFSHVGVTHETFRKGNGPAVIIVHEIPGITPAVEKFANEVVDAGFTVVMPLLVGTTGVAPSGKYMASSMLKVCISREFTTMAVGQTSPVVSWLRALAKQLHDELGGKGVGAIGMCFSGGFALGMMVDDIVVAPVLSQPSLPFAVSVKRSADLGLSPQDATRVAQRASEGCQVLGLRFTGDKRVGTRFAELHKLLGDAFIAVEFESTKKSDHSVLTEQHKELGVQRVIEFLKLKLF
ncbi:MAG: dienelactone hydrolase family protein [Actinobacteria bacterium]|nr:dienelactone hydrolase family protein [Actinomycetota bacterium]